MPVTISSPGQAQEDLNLGSLRQVFQFELSVAFGLCAELSGQYLYFSSAGNVAMIDMSNPFGPFLTDNVVITGLSILQLTQVGNYLIGFSSNRLCIFDVSDPANMLSVYTPTAALGNVRSGNFGDTSGQFIYTTKGSSPANTVQVVDFSDPTAPYTRGTISAAANTPANGMIFDNGNLYCGSSTVLQAFDVSDPDSLVLLSSLSLSTLPEAITAVHYIRSAGSFLYLGCSNAALDTYLVIVNKNDPTAMVIESITPVGLAADGYSRTTFVCLQLFFPFVGVLVENPGLEAEVKIYDVRQFDAPEFKQTIPVATSFLYWSILGNQMVSVGLSAVRSYILFGTNVSNANIGSFTAGSGNVIGEVKAGKATIVGPLTARDDMSVGRSISAGSRITSQRGVMAQKTRDLLRLIYMLGGD